MILDSVHLLYEAGFNVLPNNMNPLKQGWVRPPNAMDGIPAPLSITVNPEDTIISKVSIFEDNSTLVGNSNDPPRKNSESLYCIISYSVVS